MVGAYQEILGDMHDLFGDTYMVNIVTEPDETYRIYDEEPGDTFSEILSYLHIDTEKMRHIWLKSLSTNMSGQYKKLVINELEAFLYSNSYLGLIL